MIAVKGAHKRVAKCPGARYAKALEAHQRIEAELARTMRRWDKSRETLRRVEKALDKAQQEQWSAALPGSGLDPFDDISKL